MNQTKKDEKRKKTDEQLSREMGINIREIRPKRREDVIRQGIRSGLYSSSHLPLLCFIVFYIISFMYWTPYCLQLIAHTTWNKITGSKNISVTEKNFIIKMLYKVISCIVLYCIRLLNKLSERNAITQCTSVQCHGVSCQ